MGRLLCFVLGLEFSCFNCRGVLLPKKSINFALKPWGFRFGQFFACKMVDTSFLKLPTTDGVRGPIFRFESDDFGRSRTFTFKIIGRELHSETLRCTTNWMFGTYWLRRPHPLYCSRCYHCPTQWRWYWLNMVFMHIEEKIALKLSFGI